MATEKPRFTITMDENLLDQIDDYKFTNRIKNQSKAIHQWCNKRGGDFNDKYEADHSGFSE